MKRIAVFLLLVALGVACSIPANAQRENARSRESDRQARKAAKQNQKAIKKIARQQRKAIKKYQKEQRKAAKTPYRRAK